MHFTLLKISPEAAPTHGFDDAILPLYYALGRLGFAVEIRENIPNPDTCNIVFGSCIDPHRVGRILPHNSIIYNLEQFTDKSPWFNKLYLSHLQAFTVWDYSQRNIERLATHGIVARHVPLGYVPEMTRLNLDPTPSYDILLYGFMNQRRQAIPAALKKAGASVMVAPIGTFGAARDKLICQARLILNVHFYIPASLELVRLGYLWANKKIVVSERQENTEVPTYLNEACAYFPYEELVEGTLALLRDQKEQERQAQKGFIAFSSCLLTDTLQNIVGKRVRASQNYSSKNISAWCIDAVQK